jgi:hypothetical protein
MGPWKKFESTVVRLKRNYEDTGSVVCLTTKGRQLERNFEELKPASHVVVSQDSKNLTERKKQQQKHRICLKSFRE